VRTGLELETAQTCSRYLSSCSGDEIYAGSSRGQEKDEINARNEGNKIDDHWMSLGVGNVDQIMSSRSVTITIPRFTYTTYPTDDLSTNTTSIWHGNRRRSTDMRLLIDRVQKLTQ